MEHIAETIDEANFEAVREDAPEPRDFDEEEVKGHSRLQGR